MVVAHDAVVLMMRAVIEQLSWDGVTSVATGNVVRNASITTFDGRSGTLVLDRYNSVDHLDGIEIPATAAPDYTTPPDTAA